MGLTLLLGLLAQAPDSSGVAADAGALFTACAMVTPYDGSYDIDSTLAEFCGRLRISSGIASGEASLAASAGDTTSTGLRSGRVALTWPGTPWIGASAAWSMPGLFAAGLGDPVVEHDWIGPDSVVSAGVSLGGLLGMRMGMAAMAAGSDTLTVFSVGSPWLGFGAFDYWRCADIDSAGRPGTVTVISGMLDFRYVQPRFVLAGTGEGSDHSAILAEILGIELARTMGGSLSLVPSACISGDSAEAPGGAYRPGRTLAGLSLRLTPETEALSWDLGGSCDFEDPGRSWGGASLEMISMAGFRYALGLRSLGRPSASLAAGVAYFRSGASLGIDAEAFGDSVRIGGEACYSPLRGVSSRLRVSADADSTPEPAVSLSSTVSAGTATGTLEISRSGGRTLASLVARIALR